jgi:hypothetical protein
VSTFFSNLLAFLAGLPSTIATFLTRPAPPLPPVSPTAPIDVHANLVKLILSRTESLGPMPTTGGVLHEVSAAQADNIATLIIAASKSSGVRVSLIQSLIDGESKDDPNAEDPNDQLDTPGETAEQKAQHEDLGIEQEDVSTAEGNPSFKGLTLAQLEAKLMDPAYGVSFVAATLAENIQWAKAAFVADPQLVNEVPNGDPEVMGCHAYNSGQRGAIDIARNDGLKGPWSYGLGVVERAAGWAALLDA